MKSNGLTALATSGDTAVTAFTITGADLIHDIFILNGGTVWGFFSVDNGNTWFVLPGTVASTNPIPIHLHSDSGFPPGAVKIKRIASGTDLATVWAFGH